MSSEQLYANGRIAVLSNKLLGKDKYVRIAECNSVVDALKVLAECGYTTDGSDCELPLRVELERVLCEIKELCTNQSALRFLLCKYDCHNLKVLMKGKYARANYVTYCFENASFAPQELHELVLNDDYSRFPRLFAESCDEADAQFANGNRSPQLIDRLLDKAYFAETRRLARSSMSRLLVQLADLQTDAANLVLLKRLPEANEEQLENWLIEGGTLKRKTLFGLWQGDSSATVPEQYKKLFNSADPEMELATLRRRLVAQFADPLSIQPAIEYFYAKVEETELLRRLLSDVKKGVDKEKIKEKINAHA